MQACADGRLSCLRVLIAAGAELNASGERGMTPLIIAAQENEASCLAALSRQVLILKKRMILAIQRAITQLPMDQLNA